MFLFLCAWLMRQFDLLVTCNKMRLYASIVKILDLPSRVLECCKRE